MSLYELVWSEQFWLPAGFTWRQLERDDNTSDTMFKARLSDLTMSFVCAAVLFLVRFLLDRLVCRPIGRRFGLHDPGSYTPHTKEDKHLEVAFQSGKRKGAPVDYAALSRTIDRSEVFVSNWFRVRRNRDKANQLTKFSESAWQFIFYAASFTYGIVILWDKPYFWETRDMFRDWPYQHVTTDVYWYYMVELGYYWTALATVFSDTKRKDFREMFLHHLVTIVLMVFSWSLNFARVGALILVLHDAVDPVFNMAKLGSYTNIRQISDPAFVLFMIVWSITRLVIYPFRIVWSNMVELEIECGISPALRALQVCLLVLQTLHIIWSYFIVKMAIRVVFKGSRQDARSDSEESDFEEEPVANHVNSHGNSHGDGKSKSS